MNRRNAETRAAREHCEGHNKSHERCRIAANEACDPAQSWQGLVQRVAERRAKERPWRNHPHRAGVNRERKTARTAWAGRTVHTRRQNRRDAKVHARNGTDLRRAASPNNKRRSGMVRRLAASDDATRPANAEGNQTSREEVTDRSAARFALLTKGSAAAVQSILTDEREMMGRRRKGRLAR
jgi:hypothetical protein